jgi:hypothetical protein
MVWTVSDPILIKESNYCPQIWSVWLSQLLFWWNFKYINGLLPLVLRTYNALCNEETDAQGLTRPYNTRYAVKYWFFARILALCQARIITIPTIHMCSLHTITPMCMVGIVIIRARHSAKIWAKSLIVSKKLFQSPRTYAVKWQFLTEIQPSGFIDRFDTQ